MATGTAPNAWNDEWDSFKSSLWKGVRLVLEPVASLKLTVVLFALSIFLILAGTFAQVQKDIWEVIGLYFRCWVAWVPFQVFFPESFFPDDPVKISGGIYFPGGKTLGLLLALNLVAAHVVRFKAVAKGKRLLGGVVAIALGCLLTWSIIAAGSNSRGVLGDPLIPYSTQWIAYQGALALAALGFGFGLVRLLQDPLAQAPETRTRQWFLRGLSATLCVICAGLLLRIVSQGTASRPADASLRILWQLTQGTAASFALLAGCWIVFGKRAGIVLLHAGIGLMMFYELHVALTAVETQMSLSEGEQTNFVQDIRTFELAIVDITDPAADKVVVVPKSMLLQNEQENEKNEQSIDLPQLPFTIEIRKLMLNSNLRGASSKDENPATAGNGLEFFAEPARTGAGTDNDSKIDYPAAYVTLVSKADGKPIGTYLASLLLSSNDESDTVSVGDHLYRLELRHKRYYKPYVFGLKDVRKEDYVGTDTPRNYASTVHIHDETRHVDEEKTIWMNNPLRFADETFYQSGYVPETAAHPEHTTLSVVANTGWMMPYVGCMLVGVGMLTHFLIVLVRFLMRGESAALSNADIARVTIPVTGMGEKPQFRVPAVAPPPSIPETAQSQWGRLALTVAVVLFGVGYTASRAKPPAPRNLTFDLYRFGQIPVVEAGRAKPLDSAARAALLAISGKTEVEIQHSPKQTIPAIQWLIELIGGAEIADDRPIFRVENLELQETIGVKKREGMRYSRNEMRDHADEFAKQVHLAQMESEKDAKRLSVYQKKVLELASKIMTYEKLRGAFRAQYQIGGETSQEVLQSFQRAEDRTIALEESGLPVLAIWPTATDDKWHTLSRGWLLDLKNRVQKKTENQEVALWDQLLKAYSEDKALAFNKAVDDLLKLEHESAPADVKPNIIDLEAYFNQVQPFTVCLVLYLVAFVLGAMGWLFWPRGFNQAAFWLLVVTLVVHSSALVARLVISGRPPVTNLYSSAVFIGWGCVVLGLLFELLFRIGIGNLVAAVAGYATLLVADGLASDGDTFTVLQAVLDTQFWLATHVTCITLGYATTYVAGLFGLAYIVRGVLTPSLTVKEGRDIYRMIYGTLCFSIFFSFVGTVLGGLWADDSWGRFWGWDPKENAALIIVLWNALALHARWGGMVRERGLAALAVAGNIFVSWSWWGVNALGAGLHSYGFKQGTLQKLALFVMFNLIVIGIAMLPKHLWWSLRRREEEPRSVSV